MSDDTCGDKEDDEDDEDNEDDEIYLVIKVREGLQLVMPRFRKHLLLKPLPLIEKLK